VCQNLILDAVLPDTHLRDPISKAVFHRLATSNFHDISSSGKGVLVTVR
jgi:hypothetical protein